MEAFLRGTGSEWRELTSDRWIPLTKANNAEFDYKRCSCDDIVMWSLCDWNVPATGEFPLQSAINEGLCSFLCCKPEQGVRHYSHVLSLQLGTSGGHQGPFY